jgi:diguanylate cyclase (GGDEF)-like protein/PAS domain S-box-containing protein
MRAWLTQPTRWHGLTYAIPIGLALLLIGLAGTYLLHVAQLRLEEARATAARDVRLHAALLRRQLDHVVAVPNLLVGILQLEPSPESLRQFGNDILALHTAISSLQISPSGQAQFVLPAIGADAKATPKLPADGRLEAGPGLRITADAGGIIASLPVHWRRPGGESQFWGYATTVARLDSLAQAARLDAFRQVYPDYRLRFQSAAPSGGTVLLGSATLPGADTARETIALASGVTLTLEADPALRRPPLAQTVGEAALVLLASMLLGALAHTALRIPRRLKREVADRTRELADANRSLAEEIAERQAAERLLADSHALLDSVFEHLPGMALVKRADNLRIVRANRRAEQFLGRRRDLLLGRNNEELFPREQAARLTDANLEALRTRAVVDLVDERLHPPEAEERWIHLKSVALPSSLGHGGHILELGEDITERKRLTLNLTEHLNFIEQLLDAIPSPIFFKDAEGRYLGVNAAFERFFGKHRDELIGRTAFDIAPKDLAESNYRADCELLARRGIQVYESRILCADGVPRDVVFYKALFFATDGKTRGIVGIVLDITDRKLAEHRITQLNRTLGVIGEINQAIVRAGSRRQLLERACQVLVEKGGFALAWVHSGAMDPPRPALTAVRGAPESFAHRTIDILRASPAGCAAPGIAPGANAPLYCDAAECCDTAFLAEARGHGLASLAVLPLRSNGIVSGGLGIFAAEENAFDEAERHLLAGLADDLSRALDAIELEQRRREAESGLRLAAQVFENSSEGIMITDAENRILMVNKAFTAVTGYAATEVIGRTPQILSSGKQSPAFYREMWHALRARGEWHGEIQNRRRNGELYSEWLTISVVRSDDGELTHYVAVFSDITSRKQIEERLNFLANYDVLTSLPNRILFTDRLEQCIAKARASGRFVAALFLDLDRFKLINETLGHTAGDFMLQEISQRLVTCVRQGDSVSRLGGDEFAVILSDLARPDEAAAIAIKILDVLRRHINFNGNEIYTSASIGIGLFPNDGLDVETLVKNADSAMYQAMEDGGNTYRFYRQDMNSRSYERMTLETKLRHALERGELQVFYQPLVDAATSRIAGAEALLRWRRPEVGLVDPAEFIPLLEETGLIVPVGEWVLRTACEDNLLWRELVAPDLFVAVNFSAVQLTDQRAEREIRWILDQLKFDPSHLEIELTESVVMRDFERGANTLGRLKDIGIRLSVDDFGTGYSSLSYLKRFPIDALKIDQSFVRDTPQDREAVAIIEAIIAMSHGLGLKTIAEGVEVGAQADFLRHSRCDLLQGYHFSEPLTQTEFISLVRNNRKKLSPVPEDSLACYAPPPQPPAGRH